MLLTSFFVFDFFFYFAISIFNIFNALSGAPGGLNQANFQKVDIIKVL